MREKQRKVWATEIGHRSASLRGGAVSVMIAAREHPVPVGRSWHPLLLLRTRTVSVSSALPRTRWMHAVARLTVAACIFNTLHIWCVSSMD